MHTKRDRNTLIDSPTEGHFIKNHFNRSNTHKKNFKIKFILSPCIWNMPLILKIEIAIKVRLRSWCACKNILEWNTENINCVVLVKWTISNNECIKPLIWPRTGNQCKFSAIVYKFLHDLLLVVRWNNSKKIRYTGRCFVHNTKYRRKRDKITACIYSFQFRSVGNDSHARTQNISFE